MLKPEQCVHDYKTLNISPSGIKCTLCGKHFTVDTFSLIEVLQALQNTLWEQQYRIDELRSEIDKANDPRWNYEHS